MNPAIENFTQAVETATGRGRERSGDGFKLYCPAHNGHSPALSIGETPDGLPLLHCHAGCESESVLSAVGWNWADFHEGEPKSLHTTRHTAPGAAKAPAPNPSPSPQTLAQFCEARRLDPARLASRWKVSETTHKGRPCLRYPTAAGVDRVKFLDGAKPKYLWAEKGGRAHWYGMGAAKKAGGPVLYLVNGEPSAWACDQEAVPAVCPCGEGVKLSPEMLEDLRGSGFPRFAVCYDLDAAGRKGALAAVDAMRAAGLDAVALELPAGLGAGGDVDDLHRRAGADLGDALAALPELKAIAEAAPGWPVRLPIPEDLGAVPALPVELLPGALRPWIEDAAERACIPLEFVAVPALVGLGAVVGRSVGLRPEKFNDWTVIPNLWGGIVARPGMLKSHAISEALSPIGPLETAARERYEVERLQAEAQQEVLKAQLARMKSPKGNGGANLDPEEVAAVLREIEESKAKERRYRTSDATVEKLGELLRDNARGILLQRDELAGWLRTLDKAERAGEREFFLESWDGKGSFTFDRIGRGTVHIPALCLSVVGGIQPGKLKAYISEALIDGAGADGLLQRLQLLVWPDGAAPWKRPDRWPDHEAKRQAACVFSSLDSFSPEAFGAERDAFGGDGAPPFLRFDGEAQALFDSWRGDLEDRLRSPELERTPAFLSHLSKYRSLMPSLALLIDLSGRVTGERPEGGGVSLGAARLAAAWCDFLEAHARKVYAHELAPGEAAARPLADRIGDGSIRDGATVKSIYHAGWSGLCAAETVWAGLLSLEKLGWVRVEEVATGGRPSDVVRLHPDFPGGGK